MKQMLLYLIRIVVCAAVFSLLASTVFQYLSILLGATILFIVAISLQFWITKHINKTINQAELDVIAQGQLHDQEILQANTVTIKCAECKSVHEVPLLISERNTFICRRCKSENVIHITCDTAVVTTDITTDISTSE